jgi:hypothetical protein
VDVDSLADHLNTILEGAYVMARALGRPEMLAVQLRHYRAYLELIFDAARA